MSAGSYWPNAELLKFSGKMVIGNATIASNASILSGL
jgi:hypothetical protein